MTPGEPVAVHLVEGGDSEIWLRHPTECGAQEIQPGLVVRTRG